MEYTKSSLAIEISRLRSFASPKPRLEQYPTDSEIAADVLWKAKMFGDVEGRNIADLGCGTGLLGIGALLLGAKKVLFIDRDHESLAVLRSNLKNLNLKRRFSIIEADIESIGKHDEKLKKHLKKIEVVIQNPPFGTRDRHIDRKFLDKAFSMADIVYSFHKTSTSGFIGSFANDKGFRVTNRWKFSFPLKQTLHFHRKRIQRIGVTCFRFERSKPA